MTNTSTEPRLRKELYECSEKKISVIPKNICMPSKKIYRTSILQKLHIHVTMCLHVVKKNPEVRFIHVHCTVNEDKSQCIMEHTLLPFHHY